MLSNILSRAAAAAAAADPAVPARRRRHGHTGQHGRTAQRAGRSALGCSAICTARGGYPTNTPQMLATPACPCACWPHQPPCCHPRSVLPTAGLELCAVERHLQAGAHEQQQQAGRAGAGRPPQLGRSQGQCGAPHSHGCERWQQGRTVSSGDTNAGAVLDLCLLSHLNPPSAETHQSTYTAYRLPAAPSPKYQLVPASRAFSASHATPPLRRFAGDNR